MVLAEPMATEGAVVTAEDCGFNCNWGFGLGLAIVIVGPLPGPT